MCDKIRISHFTKYLCGTPIYILVSSHNLWIHMMNVFLDDFINFFKLFLSLLHIHQAYGCYFHIDGVV